MPRKAFIQDLEKAKTEALPPNIFDLKQGDEDGTFNILRHSTGNEFLDITVQAHVTGEFGIRPTI